MVHKSLLAVIISVAALLPVTYAGAVTIVNGTSQELILYDATFISGKELYLVKAPVYPGQAWENEDIASVKVGIKADNKEVALHELKASDVIFFCEKKDYTITIASSADSQVFSFNNTTKYSRLKVALIGAAALYCAGIYFKKDLREAFFWVLNRI